MARTEKSTALYPHPLSKAYWRDAAAELKSTKTLVIAALLIALRVATKLLSVPIAPNVRLFSVATFINALSAMIIGPVVAIPAAFISDFLGVMLWDGGAYFLPYALQEIIGSVIWALLLYRAKINTWRVMLGRFLICVIVNMIMGTILYKFYLMWMGTPVDNIFADIMTWTRAVKNLFMFPIESVIMTLFLSVLAPITYRMKLTYYDAGMLKFSRTQIIALALLFCIGAGCVGGYWVYNYNTTNQASWLSADDTFGYNEAATKQAQKAGLIAEDEILLLNKVSKQLGGDTGITFKVYRVLEGENAENLMQYRSGKLPENAKVEQTGVASATFIMDQIGNITDLSVAKNA